MTSYGIFELHSAMHCFQPCEGGNRVFNYGQLKLSALDYVYDTSDLLLEHNAALREERTWQCFLWRRQSHWVLLLQLLSTEGLEVPHCVLRGADALLGPGLVLRGSDLCLAIELLVQDDKFFPRLSVMRLEPGWLRLGDLTCSLQEIATHVVQTAEQIRSYGMLASNCQHYIQDLVNALEIDCDLPTDDLKVTQRLQAFMVTGCLTGGVTRAGIALAAGASAPAAASMLAASLAAGVLFKGVSLAYATLYSQQHRP